MIEKTATRTPLRQGPNANEDASLTKRFRVGDWVVFRKTKFSRQPGPRATHVQPAPNGDQYAYTVDKFWVVHELLPGNRVRLITRTGKIHVHDADDLRLRHARLWERMIWRDRFVATTETHESDDPCESFSDHAVQA